MESITFREYRLRLAWLREQWNRPTRSDHYLMQIAMEVRRVLSKRPKQIGMKLFKLCFNFRDEKPKTEMTEAQIRAISAAAKSSWLGRIGFGKKGKQPTKVLKDREDEIEK